MKVGDRVVITVDCKQIQPDGSVVNYKGSLGTVRRICEVNPDNNDIELDLLPGYLLFFGESELENVNAPPPA